MINLNSLARQSCVLPRAYARGGGGVRTHPWIWYVTKTLLPAQRRLIVFAYFLLVDLSTWCKLESCAGRVNPRGLRVHAFEGRVLVELAAGRERVVLGAGRARVEEFFVRATECWAKAHELNQLKNCKTRGRTEVVCQDCAWDNKPAAIITLWCNNPLLRNIRSGSCHVAGKWCFSNATFVRCLASNNSV